MQTPEEFSEDFREWMVANAQWPMLGDANATRKLEQIIRARDAEIRRECAEREPPRVCGNCKHGEPTALDPMRCYKATPYLPTGIRCRACRDWEPCYFRDNPRAAIIGEEE